MHPIYMRNDNFKHLHKLFTNSFDSNFINMILLFSMPGGSEWILVLLFLVLILIMPILAIVFYVRNKELNRQNKILTDEKNDLLKKLIDRN